MTAAALTTRPARSSAHSLWRVLDGDIVPGLLAVALFVLSRPYLGLDGDARLYFGWVLAKADPRGLGTDFYFTYNDQFGFSLFPALLRPLVTLVGVSTAGILVSLAASLCCLTALIALARSLCPGASRAGWLVVVFVAVLPVSFGTPSMFDFAETAAVPRPFAEAAVLAALACLLRERPGWALAFAMAALLIHPIMGIVGVAAVALVLAMHRPRLALRFAAVSGCAVALATMVRLPPFDRLPVTMDPEWRELLMRRSVHLFPTRWAASEYANLFVQASTIAIAARLVTPAARIVLLAILVAGLGAASAACLFGDGMHSLLFIQAQLWRSVWLISLTASASFALCVVAFARRDDAGRLTLALLAASWVLVETVWPASVCVALALALQVDHGLLSSRVRRFHVLAIGSGAAAAILAWNLVGIVALARYWTAPSAGPMPSFEELWHLHLQTMPLLLLAAAWTLSPPRGWVSPSHGMAVGAAICAAGLVAVGALSWDRRDRARLALDAPQIVPGLAALTAGRSPEIFWVDGGSESWIALGRPQWLSHLQAVGIGFSRPLALEWQRRADIALAHGLVRPSVVHRAVAGDPLTMTEAGVRAFCALPGAPGAIVLPPEAPVLPGLAGLSWRLGAAGTYRFVPCAAPAG